MQNEMSRDTLYPKSERLYLMYNRDKFNGQQWAWNSTPKIMAPTLKKDYPEVEDAVRVNFYTANYLFTVGEKKLIEHGYIVDSGFLSMFDFPMLYGNPTKALGGIYNIVLTEKLAKTLFGNDNAMGKTIKIDNTDIFTVTGVMKDLPNTTSFECDYLLPWAYMHKIGQDDDVWDNNSLSTYVLLKQNTSMMHLMLK
jgi:hypothetical protein